MLMDAVCVLYEHVDRLRAYWCEGSGCWVLRRISGLEASGLLGRCYGYWDQQGCRLQALG